jgi:N-acetylmuramoyl-L-alanine amidase
VIEMPNSTLNLADMTSAEQNFSDRLVKGMKAEAIGGTAPLTRIGVWMERVLGFSIKAQDGQIMIELRMPRNATGSLADKLIVVDAGHGGAATGASGGGVYEKNITLAIARRLKKQLEAAGARVVMTRDGDIDVGLSTRPELANSIGADLFVSIHNDSAPRPNSASGTSTYYHKGSSDSRALAVCVQRAIVEVSGLPSRGALSDGILYQNGLAVLRGSRMPAVLVEVAYINHNRDRMKLVDPDFQQRVAEAICSGLKTYVEGGNVTGASQSTGESNGETPMSPESGIDEE